MAVVYGKNNGPSGRALAQALGVEAVRLTSTRIVGRGDVNWTGMIHVGDSVNAYTCSDKLEQLQLLSNARVVVVPFSSTPLDAWLPRSRYHSGGRDFERDISPAFYTQPLPSTKEWRVHVFRKRAEQSWFAARVGWKVRGDSDTRGVEVQGVPIRSRRHGWKLKYFADPSSANVNIRRLACQAVKVLEWDFGAVDILQGTDGTFFVLEVNACPGLKDAPTLSCYATNIKPFLEL